MMTVASYDPINTVSYFNTGDGTQIPAFIADAGAFTSGAGIFAGAIE